MKQFMSDKDNVIIITVSIIAFIVGCISVGFLPAFLIIGIADALLFLPPLLNKNSKKTNTSKKVKSNKTGQLKTEKTKNKEKKKNKKKKKIFKIIIILCLIFVALLMIAGIAFMVYIVKEAPEFSPNNLYRKEATIIYDINGNEVGKIGSEKREKITYDEISETLIDAIIATEDSRYFQHNGFDLPRFLKASAQQLLTGGGGGASTLTMQVAKNNFTSTESSGWDGIVRKFTDIYLSIFQIEKNYTKKEIIEFYVNAPYLGSGTYGVEQACQTYFGKSAKDINLAESALIAGLFQAPNSYDPNLYPERAEKRRKTVLSLMERHGYITSEERKIAEKMTVDKLLVNKNTEEGSSSNEYQAFIDTVVEEIKDQTGNDPYLVPMEIYTTLDTEKQKYINNIMNGTTFKWENDKVDAGIMVIDVKTGAITAVGAGRFNVGERQYNNATMINKQIGSTSKPLYDYAPGIEYENWSTYNLYMDEEYTYSNGTKINNWDRKYNGLMTMRTALAQSRNIPALKAFQANKNSNIKTFVTNAGLSPEISSGGLLHEAHSIGGYTGESPLTMAAAYASFGNGGYYNTPYSYTKIVYRDSGEVVENKTEKKRVMSEETAYMMTSLLQSSATGGLGAQSSVNGAVYGAKTGTSNYDEATKNKWGFGPNAVNDLWVNAVSPDYAISVWYGYKSYTKGYTSTSYTIQHRKLFQTVAKGIFKTGSNWTMPDGVVEVTVENESWPAKLPSEYTPDSLKVTELFKKGTEPTEVSDRFSKLPNVTELKSNIKNNVLTLSWKAIDMPSSISTDGITNWAKSIATSQNGINSLISSRQSYNNSYIGNIVYKVYSKDNSGNLNLVKTTSDTSVDININSNSPTTYIVKTSYTIFSANISDGAEVKISLDSLESVITSELKGDKNITINTGDTFTDPGVIVLEDLTDVTNKATIKKIIKNSSGKEMTDGKLDTSKADIYTITYNITYGKFTDTHQRTVTVISKNSTSNSSSSSVSTSTSSN